MRQLIERALANGIDGSVRNFERERMRTLNAGVLMISVVALFSMPVMTLVGRSETVPGTLLFLVLMGVVAWLQAGKRPFAAALALTLIGLSVLGLQSYSLQRDFGVHYWLIALILFPLLFFPKSSRRAPLVIGSVITLSFAAFAMREQLAAGYTDESLATQILAAVVILGLSVTMRRQMVRAEEGYDEKNGALEQQADKLRRHQIQLEGALAEAREARRILDRSVEERTAELQAANARLEQNLRERTRIEEERRTLEAELQHAQRMESIGRLAGGIAHDFNNLLTVINGNIDLALEAPDTMTDTQQAWLAEAQAATERASAVTGQLLAYSRKQAVVPENLDPAAVIQAARNMIERAAGEQIRVEIRIAEDTGLVCLGKGQLEQILMNLALNGYDAMPSGGLLRIEADRVPRVSTASGPTDRTERPHIAIRVSDTGTGMSETIRSQVFDPFFTTKSSGKGTGLGLSVAHGIVTGHEGFIEVQSVEGEGSTFSIYLPVASGETDTRPAAPPRTKQSLGRGETVLIVEDEPSVRRFTSSLLKRLGYEVLSCNDGDQAIQVATEHSGRIHLLLTDVVMPGLQGPELAATLLDLRPDMSVLFVSGYAEPERLLNLNLNQKRGFLQKPFTSEHLSRLVRSLLEA